MTTDKAARLLDLAHRRQAARWGYTPLDAYHGGAYERDFVSPYTATAGNVDADVMILLQDWSSDDNLRGPFDAEAAEKGYTPSSPTNKNLIRLLREHFDLPLCRTYATNLFPFIKRGAMNAWIPVRDLTRAAREFAIPQIEIVAPRLVVCLGLATCNGLRRALEMPRAQTLAEAVTHPFSYNGSRVWCQAHTGNLGQNNRGREQVARDWLAMRIDAADNAARLGAGSK
jgi:uracil-DNA glycosylase